MQLREDPYKTPPDFVALAQAVPEFAPFLQGTSTGRPTIDFQDAAAVRALAAALLKRDFGLTLELPEDRLCPMIPSRLEYALWILRVAATGQGPNTPNLTGIDIGTGSSAVYPLLCCSVHPGVRLVGTDIDERSFEFARRNVAQNGLVDRIALLKVPEGGGFFSRKVLSASPLFDFTMCNPPFYRSEEEILELQAAKVEAPFATCTGGNLEMITPGGEVAFVTRMVGESVAAGDHIRWFSSLLGKRSSVTAVLEALKHNSIDNYAVKELQRGQTKRWVVAWSLQPTRLSDGLARSAPSLPYHLLPHPNQVTFFTPRDRPLDLVRTAVHRILEDIQTKIAWQTEDQLELFAMSNTWSRAARRRKARGDEMEGLETDTAQEEIMRVKLSFEERGSEGCALEWQWLKGADRAVFSSFWAHLTKKLSEALASGVEVPMQ